MYVYIQSHDEIHALAFQIGLANCSLFIFLSFFCHTATDVLKWLCFLRFRVVVDWWEMGDEWQKMLFSDKKWLEFLHFMLGFCIFVESKNTK